jgi:LacI family transcriptional regulator
MRKPRPDAAPRRLPVASDVAALAGVSTATVSRVLNGGAVVRPDKREAVLQAASQLGFVANGAARALSLRQFCTVGAVIPNIENDEFVRALSALQACLRTGGYSLVLASAGYDLDDELREATRMIERGIDGLLLIGDLHRPALFQQTSRLSIPVVQAFTLSETRPCVGFDNASAAGKAADYLLDLGHRRISIVTGIREENDRASARAAGVAAAMARRGASIRPEHDLIVTFGVSAGRDALRQLVTSDSPLPTAIICGTDQLAFGVLIEAQARGIDVPAQLSVIGFSDSDYAAYLNPPLTTVRIQASEIGRAAGEQLLARMAGQPTVRTTLIPAELILRGSTAPPPKARGHRAD